MTQHRYVTSAQKALVMKIQELAIDVSETSRYDAWVDYYGHCQQLDVRAYPAGGEKSLWRTTIYLPKAGRPEPDATDELAAALRRLKDLLEGA
ncbi:hypothetical protein [Modicisalibacter luteus]|uniref:Uncharacterized protein n=1 Tax=Modicisalibacter luteus TaxID=453962 RepID=A0ABV7M2W4_9GAMM|nr:hypothetical protein [Halomonas lutea]GHA85202.1 hypothetical protein GCM10007159_02850 [Halomonas lutea]